LGAHRRGEVRKEVSDNLLPTNVKNASGHAPATYTPHKHATPPPPSNQHQRLRTQAHARTKPLPWANCPTGVRSTKRKMGRPSTNPTFSPNAILYLPRMQQRAGGWIPMAFRLRSCILHLPRTQQRAGEMIFMSFRPRFPIIPASVTSQCCTAVSIDTCTAVARFLSRFWRYTRTQVGVPPGFAPQPAEIPTLNAGTGSTGICLFIGVAYSITAFPVLCRILTELKLLDTTVGTVVLSAVVGNDIGMFSLYFRASPPFLMNHLVG
jgi:hypothetical protein